MPVKYRIDQHKHLVIGTLTGVLTFEDLAEYQHRVWLDPTIAGYDELVDMRGVTSIQDDSSINVRDLAALARLTDSLVGPSKLAIVAASDYHFEIGRMYQAYREMNPDSTKRVEVFRTYEDAVQWLSKAGLP